MGYINSTPDSEVSVTSPGSKGPQGPQAHKGKRETVLNWILIAISILTIKR